MNPAPFISPEQFRSMSPMERTVALLHWLKSKPEEETYDYSNNNNCALAQFGKSIFKSNDFLSAGGWGLNLNGGGFDLSSSNYLEVFPTATLACSLFGLDFSHITFGQVAKQLEKRLVEAGAQI